MKPLKFRANDKTEKDSMLDRYADKMAEVFKPTPLPPFEPVKPIVFSNDPGTLELNKLVDEILQVLDGHTIEEIVAASTIVERYVVSQGKGQFGVYVPPIRGY